MNFLKRLSGQKLLGYPFYLFAVLMVLIAILIVNGIFEVRRTRSQLYNILETEALVVIKGLEKNSGNLLAILSQDRPPLSGPGIVEGSEESLSIEDLLIERLINLALLLDQESAQKKDSPQTLEDRLARSGLSKVYFLKSNAAPETWEALPDPLKTGTPFFQNVLTGKTRLDVFRGEGPLRKTLPLAVAVARRFDQGIILLPVSFDEYVVLSRQIIIQGLLEDFSGKGNIAYLRVEDARGKVIAQTGEPFFMRSSQNIKRKEVRSGDPGLFWIRGEGGEFLEVIRSFQPAGKELGVVRLGLSLKEVNPIIDQGMRNIILLGAVLSGLGMISLFIIFRLQGRHLQKMKEMEKQIRLKEEFSAMGHLAAGVAHEIKNPLNAISLVVQRLEKEFVRDNPEEQKEYDRFTRIVRNEITRVNQIIGDFLMMAKPLDTILEDHSIMDILNYVLEVMEEEFRQKRVLVAKELDKEIPLIICDRFQLTQAFINIFNNALEAMPDGGKLRLAVKRVRLSDFRFRISELEEKDSTIRNPQSAIEIIVADTGKGIPPEALEKIFAPYYTTKGKGVGLGLAITQRMIQAHKGTLEVQSLENQGTTVIIRLPVSPIQ